MILVNDKITNFLCFSFFFGYHITKVTRGQIYFFFIKGDKNKINNNILIIIM